MALTERFAVSRAVAQGRDHHRLHRDGQDGAAITASALGLGLAVTDGCGSARQSEVGARLGAAWLAENAPAHLASSPTADEGALAIERGLVAFLGAVAAGISDDPRRREALILDLLLFSFVCGVVTDERVVVVGRGDGLVVHDGVAHVLEPGPGNAPSYVAYELSESLPEGRTRVIVDAATHEATTLLLATDGLLPLTSDASALGALLDRGRTAKGAAWLARALRQLTDGGPVRDDVAAVSVFPARLGEVRS
jgi:hypothetical protein